MSAWPNEIERLYPDTGGRDQGEAVWTNTNVNTNDYHSS